MLKIGDRVEFILRDMPSAWLGWAVQVPRRGEVYTVRRLFFDPHYMTGAPGHGLWLEELHNPPTLREGREPSFSVEYFRKLWPDQVAGMRRACELRPRRPAVEFTGPPLPVSRAPCEVGETQHE